jgi:hypothetical protein
VIERVLLGGPDCLPDGINTVSNAWHLFFSSSSSSYFSLRVASGQRQRRRGRERRLLGLNRDILTPNSPALWVYGCVHVYTEFMHAWVGLRAPGGRTQRRNREYQLQDGNARMQIKSNLIRTNWDMQCSIWTPFYCI